MPANMQGHKTIIMYNGWLFDETEYKIYEIDRNRRGKIVGLRYVARVVCNNGIKYTEKIDKIPACIIESVYDRIEYLSSKREKQIYGI